MSQPMPTKGRDCVQDEVIANLSGTPRHILIPYIEERLAAGIETYGTPLETFNGRDAAWDAMEEILDALIYVKQELMEADGCGMSVQEWSNFSDMYRVLQHYAVLLHERVERKAQLG